MKTYQKAEMIAKNLASGSYAAGCPAKDRGCNVNSDVYGATGCTNCERTR